MIPALRLLSLIKATFMSVAMYPGAMALTLIPLAIHSLESALVNCEMPPLDAAYAGTVMPPWNERSDATLIIEPRRPDENSDSSRARR